MSGNTDTITVYLDETPIEVTITMIDGAAGGGAGDVTGPALSTDNAVARFDSTSGKIIQDSLVTVADTTGAISINAHTAITDPGASPSGKFLRDDGTWQTVSAGAGDVVGPVSSTDNAIARFDFATGKLLQNSLATVSDDGGINIPSGQTFDINGSPHTHAGLVTNGDAHDHNGGDGGQISYSTLSNIPSTFTPSAHEHAWTDLTSGTPNYIPMDITPTAIPTTEGTVAWNPTDHTLDIQSDISSCVMQVGQEMWVRVVNKTGTTLANGKVVYLSGAQGNRPTVAKADADNTTADSLIGVVTAEIIDNAEGYVTTDGIVRSVDTSSWAAGDALYVSATAGELTNVAPVAPKHANIVGYALNSTNNGSILVAISKRCDLSILHDVLIGTLADGEILQYDLAATLWKNKPLARQPFHGFVNSTDSTLAMSSDYLQITTSGTYDFYINGVKFTKSTTQQVQITADQDETFVYYDNTGTLQKSTSPWDITDLTKIPVAVVYKDSTKYKIYNERHSYLRNLAWHDWAHCTIGARYESGLTGTFTSTTLSITQGVIHDEDQEFDSGGTITTSQIWYRNSGATAMTFETAQSSPFKAITGALQYDLNGTLTSVNSNKYVNSWFYAVPGANGTAEIVFVVGQNQYTTQAAARSATPPVFPGITTLEWKLIYRVMFQNSGGTPTYIEAQDYRSVSTGPAATYTPTDHASLTGRDSANSHPITAISGINANFQCTIGDGINVPLVNSTVRVLVPWACTVTAWRIYSETSGSAVVDCKVGGTSLVGAGNKPTLSTATSNNATVSSWTTTALAQYDWLQFNLDSVTSCKQITVFLNVTLA